MKICMNMHERALLFGEERTMSTSITIPTELEKKAETPSLRELFADTREKIQSTGMPDNELDVRIESAVKEVRNQHRA